MTLLQVKNQLINYFLSFDTFEFEKNQLEVVFDKETADFREPMLVAAFAEFEAAGIVKRMAIEGREIWVLTQPINAFIQQVNVGPHVANMLASTIDGINELEEVDSGTCNVMKVGEDDLMRVIMFANEMLDVVEKGPGPGGSA